MVKRKTVAEKLTEEGEVGETISKSEKHFLSLPLSRLYFGTYKSIKVDSKARVILPSPLREVIERRNSNENGIVLCKANFDFDDSYIPYLAGYDSVTFYKYFQKERSLPESEMTLRAELCVPMPFDKQGRITLGDYFEYLEQPKLAAFCAGYDGTFFKVFNAEHYGAYSSIMSLPDHERRRTKLQNNNGSNGNGHSLESRI